MADDKLVKCVALIFGGQTNGGLVTPVDPNHEDPKQRNTKVWPESSLNFQIVEGEIYMVHPAFLAADKTAGNDKTRRKSIFQEHEKPVDPIKTEGKK